MSTPAVLLCGGAIFSHSHADSLAIEGDRILAVGRRTELSERLGGRARLVELDGRAVLPGFVDAHVHLFHTGLSESGWRVDLAGLDRAATAEALEAVVRQRGAREWVVGVGWDESAWADRRYLERRELDRIAPDAPLMAVRMDGHLVVANAAALRWADEHEVPDLDPGLVDAERGILRETAAWALLRAVRPDRATLIEAMRAAVGHCHAQGITAVHTMSAAERLDIVEQEAQRLRLRIAVYAPADASLDWESLAGDRDGRDPWARLAGAKIFSDGSIGAQNAAVGAPYLDGGVGSLNWDDDPLRRWIERAERIGRPTAIHAIGDRAIDQVLRLHEKTRTTTALRHRIEHFELPAPGHIERARDVGITVCMQPNFIGRWSGPGSMYEDRLGVDRDAASNPLRRVLDAGLDLALGSDGMPISPLYGIHSAVNAPFLGQRLMVDEAVVGYTRAGIRLAFDDLDAGRIEPGAIADLVVLDEDPRLDPGTIAERAVEETYVGGVRVFARETAP